MCQKSLTLECVKEMSNLITDRLNFSVQSGFEMFVYKWQTALKNFYAFRFLVHLVAIN